MSAKVSASPKLAQVDEEIEKMEPSGLAKRRQSFDQGKDDVVKRKRTYQNLHCTQMKQKAQGLVHSFIYSDLRSIISRILVRTNAGNVACQRGH